ncbi:MAG TPA: hypothetical protein VE974_10730 [Thermoanaerobaculia bacterium]|nr:hypothetical protein [Thermoanaerobaculia bacterium]
MKTRILFVIVAAAFLAAPSFAAVIVPREPVDQVEAYSGDYDYGTGAYLDNPCTAVQDWYYVNYDVYVSQFGSKLAGSDRYRINETTSMAGSYAASGTSSADITYTGKAFSTREYHKVTSTSDMFHVVTVINVDPATQQTTVTIETACGDGTPASKQ